MEITDIDQEINDYDWFATDSLGNIGHFASSGGVLPRSVASSAEDLELLVNYFQSHSITEYGFSLAPAFSFPKSIRTDWDRNNFLRSYSFYSTRGLYSFDRNQVDKQGRETDLAYGSVTIPTRPITMNLLPLDVQMILSRTQYKRAFSTEAVVDLLLFKDFS